MQNPRSAPYHPTELPTLVILTLESASARDVKMLQLFTLPGVLERFKAMGYTQLVQSRNVVPQDVHSLAPGGLVPLFSCDLEAVGALHERAQALGFSTFGFHSAIDDEVRGAAMTVAQSAQATIVFARYQHAEAFRASYQHLGLNTKLAMLFSFQFKSVDVLQDQLLHERIRDLAKRHGAILYSFFAGPAITFQTFSAMHIEQFFAGLAQYIQFHLQKPAGADTLMALDDGSDAAPAARRSKP